MGNPRSINQRKFPDTGVIYQYRDNNLAKVVPFMNMSMSIYGGFCHSTVVRWTLDKRISPYFTYHFSVTNL